MFLFYLGNSESDIEETDYDFLWTKLLSCKEAKWALKLITKVQLGL